jgi:hypothetical protein
MDRSSSCAFASADEADLMMRTLQFSSPFAELGLVS